MGYGNHGLKFETYPDPLKGAGAFIDEGGDDDYRCPAPNQTCHGYGENEGLGVFLDDGGTDSFLDPPPGNPWVNGRLGIGFNT